MMENNKFKLKLSEKFLLLRFYLRLCFDCIFGEGVYAYTVYENNLKVEFRDALMRATTPIDQAAEAIEQKSVVASPSEKDVIIKIVN